MTDKQEQDTAAEVASGDTIMKADVEKMIRDWQAECGDHPALHNQGNVLLRRLKALKPSLAMNDFLTGMDCLAERPTRGEYALGLQDGIELAVESREALKPFLPSADGIDADQIAKAIVRAACELGDTPDPDGDDTILITTGDLEAVAHRHITAALERTLTTS